MKKLIPLFILLLGIAANASIYTRQHSATIQPGKKILASDLNDEYNAIATAVNSIDGSNVTNGSLGVNAFAATSSAISLNKKSGCAFTMANDVTGTKSVSIAPPCEIFMDGTRGFITATQSISLLTDLLDGSLAAANFYYIYATRNSSAALTFRFSQQPPLLLTARKLTDSTARYVGTVRTCDATQDIAVVTRLQESNHFRWNQSGCLFGNAAPESGLIATANSVTSAPNLTVPNTFQALEMKYTAFHGPSFPAQCEYSPAIAVFSDFRDPPGDFQAIAVATAGNTGIVPFGYSASSGFVVNNISNCAAGGNLRVIGWWEPFSLHQ